MENTNEAAPIAAIGKGVAAAGKAAAKGASKASKPVARKLTTRRNVKNPKYRNPDGSFNKKLYDQDGNPKTQGYMSNIEKPTDSRSTTHSGSMRQTAKVQDAEKKDTESRDKKVKDTAQNLKKKTGDTIKKTGETAGRVIKKTAKAIGSGSSAFGTSSFSKESKITFKDYLKKL